MLLKYFQLQWNEIHVSTNFNVNHNFDTNLLTVHLAFHALYLYYVSHL